MTKPTIGRIVLFKARDTSLMGYGVTEAPAIITKVLSDTRVNLTVFRDGAGPQTVAGVELAEALGDHPTVWRWLHTADGQQHAPGSLSSDSSGAAPITPPSKRAAMLHFPNPAPTGRVGGAS